MFQDFRFQLVTLLDCLDDVVLGNRIARLLQQRVVQVRIERLAHRVDRRDLEPLEAPVRDEINKRIARGRLNVRVALHAGADGGAAARVNTPLARAYAAELAKLAAELNLSGGVRLSDILRAPGVLEAEEDAADAESGPVVTSTPGARPCSGCPGVLLPHCRKFLMSSSERS